MRPLSFIKNSLVPEGRTPRRVRFGLYHDIILELDLRSQTQMLLGLWERETYRFIKDSSAKVRWFVDVGAGSGELSIYFLRCPERIKVIAAEPDPNEVECFRRQLRLNGFSEESCEILNEKISNRSGDLKLADIVGPLQGPGFIKIDVDGAEVDVLESAADQLEKADVAILIETHSAQLEIDCHEWLAKRGYETSIIQNSWWRRFLSDGRVIDHNRWLAARRPV